MGLFEIQRRLAAETRAKTELADRTASGHGGLDAFLADAWQHVRDPVYLARLYDARARRDPDTALALARLADRGPSSLRALIEEQRILVAPRLASELFADSPSQAAELLVELGDPRVAPLALELAAACADDHLRVRLATVAAAWGDDAAREIAATHLAGDIRLAAQLARHGHPAAHAALTGALRHFLNERIKGRRTTSGAWAAPFAIVDAIVEARVLEATPLLIAALATPLVARALRALGKLGVARAREPARGVLREVGGNQPTRVWAYRLAAENCLSALDEPQPVTTARAALAAVHPVRYGYPKLEDVLFIRQLALEALIERGTPDDLEQVARGIHSTYRVVRQAAAAALARLGRPLPPLRWLDEPRCKTLTNDALAAALTDPHAVFAHHAASGLASRSDVRAVDWALDLLEHTHNHPASYLERSDIGDDQAAALDLLEEFKDHPDRRERIAASASAWVRRKLFDDKPAPAPPPPLTGPWRASVIRLDRAPFVFGAQINALAVDAAGRRLAVVGDRLGQIVDATTGDLITTLDLEYVWAHDCAFSPDGSLLAVAYHGCHVVLFDPTTGARLRRIHGHGGVPDATKRLAFSPDGELLAFCGSDGSARVVRWRSDELVWSTAPRDGAFEALAFSPDGTTCLFSHVKTRGGERNYLVRLDITTRAADTLDSPSSVWSIAPVDGRWYTGGEAKKLRPLHPKTLAPARAGGLEQAGVVRLAAAPDGALLAVSQTGLLRRWDVAGGQARDIIKADQKLWALAVAPDGTIFTAGSGGVVHRFTAAGAPLPARTGEVHSEQVSGIAALPDGTTLTTSWDGRLLRWPAEFGAAALVLAHDSRLTAVVADPSGTAAYAGSDGRLFAVDLAAGTTRSVDLGEARVEDLALAGDDLHVAATDGHVHTFTTADLRERARVEVGDDPTALALTADDTLIVGTEAGHLLEIDARGEIDWSRAEFGRDLVDKDPYGSPHRTVVGVAAHAGRFVAAANDDTLRVFDRAGPRRTLRLMTPTGLFNDCDFSPDGRTVAVSDSGLAVFDAATGDLLVHISRAAFPGADELTVFSFTAPLRVLAGAKNGALFAITLEAP